MTCSRDFAWWPGSVRKETQQIEPSLSDTTSKIGRKNILKKKKNLGPYRFWFVKHSNTKIPEQQSTIVPNTPKSICSFVALPWVKGNAGHP
jgi:hypothetical protein